MYCRLHRESNAASHSSLLWESSICSSRRVIPNVQVIVLHTRSGVVHQEANAESLYKSESQKSRQYEKDDLKLSKHKIKCDSQPCSTPNAFLSTSVRPVAESEVLSQVLVCASLQILLWKLFFSSWWLSSALHYRMLCV